jgi:hypothetical protein
MKDRQRFADKLSHYQLRKGPRSQSSPDFAMLLIQQFRTARSAIGGATQDQATGFLYP